MGRAAVAFLFAAAPVFAKDAALGESDRRAIRGVIEAQLDAFARDDGEAAFSRAAPGIRAKFGDAGTFMAMVRAAYAPVYRPRETRFLDLDVSGALPVQRVLVVDSAGAAFLAHYPMQRQPDGAWRIAGCVLVPWDGAGARRGAPSARA